MAQEFARAAAELQGKLAEKSMSVEDRILKYAHLTLVDEIRRPLTP